MKNSNTPPTANNHIDHAPPEGPCEPTPVPVDPLIIRVSDFGLNDTAGSPTDMKTAVQ